MDNKDKPLDVTEFLKRIKELSGKYGLRSFGISVTRCDNQKCEELHVSVLFSSMSGIGGFMRNPEADQLKDLEEVFKEITVDIEKEVEERKVNRHKGLGSISLAAKVAIH